MEGWDDSERNVSLPAGVGRGAGESRVFLREGGGASDGGAGAGASRGRALDFAANEELAELLLKEELVAGYTAEELVEQWYLGEAFTPEQLRDPSFAL